MFKELSLSQPLETSLEENIVQTLEVVKGIRVFELDSGIPGDCFVFTAGVHGEETLGDEKIVDLLQEFLEKNVTFLKGKIYLIPNLNVPGCKDRTRYVFEDEADTHLNNVFDRYQTGNIQELVSLDSKTAMYAWLVMNGLATIRDKHRKQHGEDKRMFHIDLHAEETAIPEIFIDRMDEDPELLQRLITAVRPIGLPFFLDYPAWREMGDNQILSAATAGHGFNSATIEEGKTRDPDIYVRRYIAWRLLEHLGRLGFISINKDARERHKDIFDSRYLTPGLKKSQEIWSTQFRSETIYSVDDILPALIDFYGVPISGQRLLSHAIEDKNWDGILSLIYQPGLRGSRGKGFIDIAKILYGSYSWSDYLTMKPYRNAIIQSGNFPADSWILSVAEPPDPDDRIVPYAFFLDKKEGNQTLRLDILDTDQKYKSLFKASQLRELINSNPGIDIDLSILEVTCAVPDPRWKGSFDNGEFILSPRL